MIQFRKLVLLLLLCPSALMAQIRGTVWLPDNEPATYATVMLYADSNTNASPLAYAITDGKGMFNIKATPSPKNWLVVRYLGYKEYRQPIDAAHKHYDIRLIADAQQLNAVKVEAEYKSVEISGDTIKFNTEYFKTGAEDNAAEVLNKIPGMEVDDNGDVSYAGKKVDRITVDGRDLFSSGSDGALNTLSADAIQGAELLTRGHSNSIIDNFSGRELTTLNLTTDGRTRANGKVSALAGIRNKFKSENSLLLIGKKLSLTVILSANNTGEAVFSFGDYIRHIVGLENLLSSHGEGFHLSDDEIALLMPPSNVYASNNGVATLSGNWKPSDKFSMKGNLILNGTGLEAESLSQLDYVSLGFSNNHSLQSHNRNLFFTGQMQQTWTPTENVEFSNHTQFIRSRMESQDSLNESGFNNMRADEDNGMSKQTFNEEMVLNIQQGNSMFSVHFNMTHSRRNYSYGLLTDRVILPFACYLADGSDYRIDTHKDITDFEVAPDISYALQVGNKHTLNATLGFSHSHSELRYGPQAVDSVVASINFDSPFAEISFNKNKGLFRYSIGASMDYEKWTSTIDGLPDSEPSFTILPHAELTLQFSSTHRLSLSASMDDQDIDLEHLLRAPMVTGYNSICIGSQINDPQSESRNLNLNYYIFDLFSNTLFFAGAGITSSSLTLKPHSIQDSNTVTFTLYNNDGEMTTRYLSSHISKGLGSWPIDAKLFGTVTQSDSKTTVNNTDGNIASSSYSLRFALVSRSKKPYNAEIGFDYQTTSSEITALTTLSSKLQQQGAYAAFIVSFKRFNGEVRYSYTHLENNSYTRNFHDLSFRMEYRMGNWRLMLRGSNLLHLDSMDWLAVNSSPYAVSTVTYRKVPGHLLAGLAYRF